MITRKAFGGAYDDGLEGRRRRRQLRLADGAVRGDGRQGAVEIIFRADIGDKEKIAARTKEYEDRFLSPFVAAERGYIDEACALDPEAHRRALAMLRDTNVEMPARKHDNLPL